VKQEGWASDFDFDGLEWKGKRSEAWSFEDGEADAYAGEVDTYKGLLAC
jgi:hypothetical protein